MPRSIADLCFLESLDKTGAGDQNARIVRRIKSVRTGGVGRRIL